MLFTPAPAIPGNLSVDGKVEETMRGGGRVGTGPTRDMGCRWQALWPSGSEHLRRTENSATGKPRARSMAITAQALELGQRQLLQFRFPSVSGQDFLASLTGVDAQGPEAGVKVTPATLTHPPPPLPPH